MGVRKGCGFVQGCSNFVHNLVGGGRWAVGDAPTTEGQAPWHLKALCAPHALQFVAASTRAFYCVALLVNTSAMRCKKGSLQPFSMCTIPSP